MGLKRGNTLKKGMECYVEEKKRVQRREPPEGGSRRSTQTRYAPEQKLKAVRLVVESGFSRYMVSQEIGVCIGTLDGWRGIVAR